MNELELLIIDVYEQGYQCGINDNNWFTAYANAAKRIVTEGIKFSNKLVDEEYNKLK